jgi:zinc-binding alcohol dehydrogenase/oxidoreductase
MKAVVLHKLGDISELDKNLLIEEVPVPEVSGDEVLIKVHYASLNHRDVWITKGLYSKIKLPLILGSDCSGTIEKLGGGAAGLEIGQEVIINPSINWGENDAYQSPAYEILGLPQDGTLAEYVKIKAKYVYPKPAHLNFEQASALPLGGLTAYRAAILKAKITPSDKVLITGIGGGVATFALLYSLAIGADTYVTSGSDEKITRAVSLGAKSGVNYKVDGWADTLKEKNITVVIDSSGGDTIAKALDFTSYGARIVTYGATNGTINDFDIRRVYWKQLQVLGSTMGSDKDFSEMLAFVNKNKIIPVVDEVFALEDTVSAFKRMNDGGQFGKIVIKIA